MSNTSTVTPYVGSAPETQQGAGSVVTLGAACAVGAVIGLVAAARWLAEETEQEAAAVASARAERRRERLGKGGKVHIPLGGVSPITSVELHLREPEGLIRSAERLGYRVDRSIDSSRSGEVFLRSMHGERIAIGRSAVGRVVLGTAGGQDRLRDLVRRHTEDRVTEHLSTRGMSVQSARLPSGEVQLLARENASGRSGGAAQVQVQIQSDGTAWLDIEKVRGSRCEQIVAEVAEAMGGEVCRSGRKDAYFQLPGEPTKTGVKV